MLSILITLAVFLSAIGYGSVLPLRGGGERLLIRLGAGLWFIAHLVFLLGITSLLYRISLLVVLLPGVALLIVKSLPAFSSQGLSPIVRKRWPQNPIVWLMLLPILFLVVLALSGALTPPIARDSLVYHLALPKLYLQHHQWVEIPENIYSFFPGLAESLYTLVLGLGSRYPALVHAVFGVICLGATITLGRMLSLQCETCLLGVAALVATPTFWAEMTWAYVDLVNTFYWALAAICFLRWQENKERYWLPLLGFCAGAASGCKYTSLILIPIIPLGLLFELKKSGNVGQRQILLTVFIPVITTLLVVSPWLGRNLILTGNPLYPFFWDLFPSSTLGWDAERASLYQIMLTQYGGTNKGLVDYLTAPFRVFLAGRFNSVSHYDGVLNFFYLLAWPLFFVRKQWGSKSGYLLGLSLVYLAYWSLSTQQARFLLVLLPIMAILAGYCTQIGLREATRKIASSPANRLKVERLALVFVLALILFGGKEILNLYEKGDYLDYLTGKKSTEAFLEEKLGYYGIYRYINEDLPEEASLLLVKTGNRGYYLDRSYFSDAIFESHTFGRILANANSAADVARICRQRGWTHLLIRLGAFLKAHGPVMPGTEMEHFQSFLNNQCRLLKKNEDYWLFEIRDIPAAPEKTGLNEELRPVATRRQSLRSQHAIGRDIAERS